MFSQGQLIFAGIFAISFIAIVTYSYIKDKKIHTNYYKKWMYVYNQIEQNCQNLCDIER